MDSRWVENRSVLQQLLSIYMVLSSNRLCGYVQSFPSRPSSPLPHISHHSVHPSSLLQIHPIVFGIISICSNLAQSSTPSAHHSSLEEGRHFLKSIHIFDVIKPAIPIYGYDAILRQNAILVVKGMCRSPFSSRFSP